MSSPPPAYSSLQSPPAYFYSRKLPACPPRQSSRQMLSDALQRARHAVHLDSSGSKSNIPSAVTAYGEAIELLQRVIARRSQKPGNEAEVERVVAIVSLPPPFSSSFPFPSIPLFLRRLRALCRKAFIGRVVFFFLCPGRSLWRLAFLFFLLFQHDRYVHRVRELCRARRLPLPSHVADAPPASCHPLRDPLPDGDAGSPMSAHESEWDADLSSLLLSSSSSSATGHVLSSPSSAHSAHDHDHDDGRNEWIVSEACDEEVKEWGQLLDGSADERRASVATAASSAVWSTIAVSHG